MTIKIEALYSKIISEYIKTSKSLDEEFGEPVYVQFAHERFLFKVSDFLSKKIKLSKEEEKEMLNKMQRIVDGAESTEACLP